MKFAIQTLGCKANFADGQILEVRLSEKGFIPTRDLGEADLVIVNSCTVTDEADRQSKKMAKKMAKDLARKNPHVRVIYTGCGAEVDPSAALKIPGISAVIGNQDKGLAADLIESFLKQDNSEQKSAIVLGGVTDYSELSSRHPHDREWNLPESSLDEMVKLTAMNSTQSSTYRTRAFVKVQEGCNAFCTYCIIPYGRGPSRSLPIEAIVEKISVLVKQGIQEVILTGTNIGDYGVDWAHARAPQTDSLIEAILMKSGVRRLRVGSLDPTEITERTVALMEKYENFCPHFHVSLQHVNSKILKLMKRKYGWLEAQACFDRLATMKRKPFIGMDYIVGFPGETDTDFNESVEKLRGLYWQKLHVFPYSERSSTPATRLPHGVPMTIRKQRAKILQALSLERLTQHYAQTRQSFSDQEGLLKDVLLEGSVRGPDGTRNWVSGYTPQYQRVIVPVQGQAGLMNGLVNQVRDIKVNHWLVDRSGGEVSWIGRVANQLAGTA